MSIKISELPVASSVNSTDIVPIVQDGTTKQAQADMFKPQIETVINSSSTNDKPVGAKAVYEYSAPIKHDSETQDYGVATTTKYGHTKIIDSLDSSSYQVGESLSAYQGAVLKQRIDNINDDIENITDELATKQDISNMTNTLDENSTETQYPNAQVTYEKYQELLDQIPTATATGNPINVQDSSNLPLVDFALLGNASQSSTPTPDTPQDIHVVTGDNTFVVNGKNLLKLTNEAKTNGGITGTITNDNILTYSGTATRAYADITNKQEIKLKANTKYTFSIDTTRTNNENIVLYMSGGTSQFPIIYGGNTFVTFTANGTNNKVYVGLTNLTTGNSYSGTIKMQVEEDSTATTYEPYTEQTQLLSLGSIELAKIGDYTDRIFKSSGKWYVEKNTEVITFNGTENWTYESTYARFYANSPVRYDDILTMLCNRYQRKSSTETGGFQGHTGHYVLYFHTPSVEIDTVAEFKTWLETHNLNVFITTTPTTTEITDTTLIGQLENVLKMHTNKNVTNISIVPTGTNAEPTAEVEYRVDLGTVIGNIQTAILSLGGNV